MKQINVTTARKMFLNGEPVYMLPSKMRPDNPWQHPSLVNAEERTEEEFEKARNAFAYYNCDAERGRGIHYYAEEERE